MSLNKIRKIRAQRVKAYRKNHRARSQYLTSRSCARTFFRKHIKPSDLPEFKGWIARCEKRFAKDKCKKQ